MSTQTKTQSTNQYDTGSMNTFNSFQPSIQSGLMSYANDPMGSSFFNNQFQVANRGNQLGANTVNQNFMWNQGRLGNLGDPGALFGSELGRNARAGAGASSNTYNNLLLGANQIRMGALNQMQGYRPLQTGGTQTNTQQGLGTWLPQVYAMGQGAAANWGNRSGPTNTNVPMDQGVENNALLQSGALQAPGYGDPTFGALPPMGMNNTVPGGTGTYSPWSSGVGTPPFMDPSLAGDQQYY